MTEPFGLRSTVGARKEVRHAEAFLPARRWKRYRRLSGPGLGGGSSDQGSLHSFLTEKILGNGFFGPGGRVVSRAGEHVR